MYASACQHWTIDSQWISSLDDTKAQSHRDTNHKLSVSGSSSGHHNKPTIQALFMLSSSHNQYHIWKTLTYCSENGKWILANACQIIAACIIVILPQSATDMHQSNTFLFAHAKQFENVAPCGKRLVSESVYSCVFGIWKTAFWKFLANTDSDSTYLTYI